MEHARGLGMPPHCYANFCASERLAYTKKNLAGYAGDEDLHTPPGTEHSAPEDGRQFWR